MFFGLKSSAFQGESSLEISVHLEELGNKQTNKQANKQASKQTSKQTNKQTQTHWHPIALEEGLTIDPSSKAIAHVSLW